MKPWLEALRAHYVWTTTRLAMFWKVQRTDGQVFAWVDHDEDLAIAGITYRSRLGMLPTGTQTTMDLQPSTLDVTSFMDVSTEEELEAGIWDDAEVTIFEAPWDRLPTNIDPTTVNILLTGRLGQITRRSGIFVAQLHGLLEQLAVVIGEVYTITCPWRLGDSRCKADLTAHTHTGSITSVGGDDPRFSMTDANSGQPAGYYNEGTLTFTSGRNVGRTGDIRHFGDVGDFVMHRPFPFPAEVGDTYSAVRGDDKTISTCRDVYNNLLHFRGFPAIPGQDQVLNNPMVLPATSNFPPGSGGDGDGVGELSIHGARRHDDAP